MQPINFSKPRWAGATYDMRGNRKYMTSVQDGILDLLDLLDLDVIQVFMNYTDASRHFSFCFLVCQVAGGIKLVGIISPVFV